MSARDDERWILDFDSVDIEALLADDEPLLSAARDTRDLEEDGDQQ